MRVSLVVAMDRNRLIGAGGGLPWRLPADLRRFRQVTMGSPVLMGRLTWNSLPRQPLPGRRNVVLSRRPGFVAPGADVVTDLDAAFALLDGCDELMVIGGAQVFADTMARADRLYLTEVDAEFAGDTWFPPLVPSQWRETAAEHRPADADNPHDMRFVTLDRVR